MSFASAHLFSVPSTLLVSSSLPLLSAPDSGYSSGQLLTSHTLIRGPNSSCRSLCSRRFFSQIKQKSQVWVVQDTNFPTLMIYGRMEREIIACRNGWVWVSILDPVFFYLAPGKQMSLLDFYARPTFSSSFPMSELQFLLTMGG